MNTEIEVDRWIDLLKQRKLPEEAEIRDMCRKAIEVLSQEETVLSVPAPATVVGDIHGQFYDLLEIFRCAGEVPDNNYIFMGDYVDRGFYSVETALLLMALKVRHPKRIALIRGNHESRQITQVYGFYDECLRKFGSPEIWSLCMSVFDHLALGCLLNDTVLCMHAGLSPSLDTLDHIRVMDRVMEVPHEGPMCDLLWSDPEDITGWGISPRGAGYLFGADIVSQFNHVNGLSVICRSHQLVMEGYKWMFDNQLCTVWSAPNYCYRCGNDAAVMCFDDKDKKNFIVYGPTPASERKKPSEDFLNSRPLPDYFV